MNPPRSFSALIGLLSAVVVAVGLWFFNQHSNSSAVEFVQNIYGDLYHQSSTLSSLDKADEIYSSTLLGLIRKEQQQQIESGEIGKLSADPLCNCQDPTSVKVVEITKKNSGDNHTTVLVFLSVSGITQKLELDLVQETKAWKIDDVASNHIPSLRNSLIEN